MPIIRTRINIPCQAILAISPAQKDRLVMFPSDVMQFLIWDDLPAGA